MQIINWIDTFMAPIVWFISLSQRVFQMLSSDRAKQVYKAIALFICVLCIAIILGFAKTIQIAFISAFEAFIEALEISQVSTEILIVQESDSPIPKASTEILTVQESESSITEIQTEILTVQKSEPLTPESIVPDLRVHSLRKAATAKGISNAGRMKKAELLVALSHSGGIPCQP